MKVLIAYDSRTGHTEKMAHYMAEGVRIAGHDVVTRKITDIKNAADLAGYEGYIFGSPTYHRDMTQTMKTFLFLAQKADLRGKVGGASAPIPTAATLPNTFSIPWRMSST